MKTEPDRPVMHTLVYGGREIAFSLKKNGRKRLKIVVQPELTVEVVAPCATEDEQVLAAVRKKAAWIVKKLDALASHHPLPSPRQYISGETIVYLGRQYRLKVQKGAALPAKLAGPYLTVQVKDDRDRHSVKRAVDAWYREKARRAMARYLDACGAVTRRHGVPEPRWTIRDMRRRWGSCSPAGRLTINLKLVQVPVHCIEYVLMHELCHLKHPNHSKAFYSLLTRCQPDWRRRKAALDRFRLS